MSIGDFAHVEDLIFDLDQENYDTTIEELDSLSDIKLNEQMFLVYSACQEMNPKKLSVYEKLREHFQIPNSNIFRTDNDNKENMLKSIMKNDDISSFSAFLTECDNDIGYRVFLFDQMHSISLLSMAGFYQASNIFDFLILNGLTIDETVLKHCLRGGSLEIVQKCLEFFDVSQFISESNMYHHNTINEFILNEYEIKSDIIDLMVLCLQHFNTSFLMTLVDFDLGSSRNICQNGSMLLVPAIRKERFDVVKYLMSKNCGVKMVEKVDSLFHNIIRYSPLTEAVMIDNFEIALKVLEKDASPDESIKFLQTPLFFVKSVEMAELLINHGADINHLDADHWSPVIEAVYKSKIDIVKFLLDKGAKFEEKILIECISNPDILKLLISKYGLKYDRNYVIRCLKYPTLLEVLIENGVSPFMLIRGQYLLNLIIKKEYTSCFLKFYYQKVTMSKHDPLKRFPIHYASLFSNDILSILVKEDARTINAKDMYGKTPLHYAAESRNLENIEILIRNGADINAIDLKGNTPLIRASQRSNLSICDFLIENGANSEIKNNGGRNYQSFL